MPRRNVAVALCLLVFLGPACSPEEPAGPTPPDAGAVRDCVRELDAWDARHGQPPANVTEVTLNPASVRDAMSSQNRDLADGSTETGERIAVGGSVVLRLDETLFVHGVRYMPLAGAAALTDFRLYLSFDAECWGDPVATNTFDGSSASQRVEVTPRAARFVRIDVVGADGGAAEAGIANLGIVVGARIRSRPPEVAAVGLPWDYVAAAEVPGPDALLYELTTAPSGMTVDDRGIVAWTPAEGQEGPHDVTLLAYRGATSVEQSFAVRVAGRRSVGTAAVPAGGGTGVISDPMGMAADVEVTVDDAAAPAATVEVFAVDGETPAAPVELAEVGSAFYVETDLPVGTPFSLRIPVAGLPGLPAVDPEESVFVTGYPQRVRREGLTSETGATMVAVEREPGAVVVQTFAGDVRLFQITKGSRAVYSFDEFEITYLLSPGQDSAGLEARLEAIGDTLVASRDAISAWGCTFHEKQSVFVRELNATIQAGEYRTLGYATEKTLHLELDKQHVDDDDPARVQATVAHEFAHIFQLIELDGLWPSDLTEDFWIEGNAEYAADEVFDVNDYLDGFSPWDGEVSSRGLRDNSGLMTYRRVSLWKSIKAQQGSFNPCEMTRAYEANGNNGIAGLGALLGGDDARLSTYATYIAAWNHVRDASVLEDAEVWFGDGATGEFVTQLMPRTAEDRMVYEWSEVSRPIPGGHTALIRLEEEAPLEIEVRAPTTNYLLYVYDASQTRIGELRPGANTLTIEVTGNVYFDIAFAQTAVAQASGSVTIDVVASVPATTAPCDFEECTSCAEVRGCSFCPEQGCVEDAMATCEQPAAVAVECPMGCAEPGGMCTGSGPDFDDECCGDMICVVGRCAPDVGGREQAPCDEAADCAAGLTCRPSGAADAPSTCVARNGDYCEVTADCTGLVPCVDNRCVGLSSGETCLSGDCAGTSFCSDGMCL